MIACIITDSGSSSLLLCRLAIFSKQAMQQVFFDNLVKFIAADKGCSDRCGSSRAFGERVTTDNTDFHGWEKKRLGARGLGGRGKKRIREAATEILRFAQDDM